MARADIAGAALRIAEIYNTDFGGKRRGRFTMTRDNLGDLLKVLTVHDTAIVKLSNYLLEDLDLCLIQRHHNRFGVVHGRKVGAWRKVTKGVIGPYGRGATPTALSDDQDDDESDE